MDYDSLSQAQKRLVCAKAKAVVARVRLDRTSGLPASVDRCVAGCVRQQCADLSVSLAATVEALAESVLAGGLPEASLDTP
jgi:hypothetical protein